MTCFNLLFILQIFLDNEKLSEIEPPGSIPGVGGVRHKQTNDVYCLALRLLFVNRFFAVIRHTTI